MRAGRDWLIVLACLICQIGMGVVGYIFPVFLKPVVQDLDWSRTAYAFANPIMSTTVAVLGPAVGWLSDRVGPRPVLVLGSLTASLALVAAGGIARAFDLYLVAGLVGVAVVCLGDLPTGAAIAGRFLGRRGLALALVYIGSNIGGALVPLAATALAEVGSWRHAFRVIGGTLWLVLLPFALVVGRGRAPATAGPAAANPAGGFPWTVLRGRDFWLLFWVLFVFYVYRLGVNVHLVAFLTDLGYSSAAAAGSLSATLALGIPGKLVVGTVADRIGAKPAVVANFAIIAVASALLLVPRAPGMIPLFIGLHGFSTAAEDVVIPLIIGQRFGIANLGRVYGLLLLALVPGGTLGPVLAGFVFDHTGSYASVFAAFLAGNVLAVVALLFVGGRAGQREDRFG